MIADRQNARESTLLQNKKDPGQYFKEFVSHLHKKFQYCRKVGEARECPNYMMTQRCLFISIMQRKNSQFNTGIPIDYVIQILIQNRQKIIKSIKQKKQSNLAKLKQIKIQKIQERVLEIMTRQNFTFNSYGIYQNQYVYELVKAICNKKQQTSFFSSQIKPIQYTQADINRLSEVFHQKIIFFDYVSSNKTLPKNIPFSHKNIYILKVKDNYMLLYVKEPKPITIIKQDMITLKQIEKIFAKNQVSKQSSSFLKSLIAKQETGSKLFPDDVQCSKCNRNFSEFDCLKWSYDYFCQKCLENPKIDTSNIPCSLVQKYFKQKGISHNKFQIICAQCTGETILKNYNPGKKPPKYKCQICEHVICLEHDKNIYECFCQCSNCKSSTFFIQSLQINICQKCKTRRCRKCQKKFSGLCACVCEKCYQPLQNSEDHLCKQICHLCKNHVNNLKFCHCGKMICYGCYYFKLQNAGENMKFQCLITAQF